MVHGNHNGIQPIAGETVIRWRIDAIFDVIQNVPAHRRHWNRMVDIFVATIRLFVQFVVCWLGSKQNQRHFILRSTEQLQNMHMHANTTVNVSNNHNYICCQIPFVWWQIRCNFSPLQRMSSISICRFDLHFDQHPKWWLWHPYVERKE